MPCNNIILMKFQEMKSNVSPEQLAVLMNVLIAVGSIIAGLLLLVLALSIAHSIAHSIETRRFKARQEKEGMLMLGEEEEGERLLMRQDENAIAMMSQSGIGMGSKWFGTEKEEVTTRVGSDVERIA